MRIRDWSSDVCSSDLIGLTEVAIIVGYRKEAVYERREALEQKYGVKITLIDNDKAEEWNNAYSLWCGRDAIKHSVILANGDRSEEHTSELQSLMRISYAVFCLKKKKKKTH